MLQYDLLQILNYYSPNYDTMSKEDREESIEKYFFICVVCQEYVNNTHFLKRDLLIGYFRIMNISHFMRHQKLMVRSVDTLIINRATIHDVHELMPILLTKHDRKLDKSFASRPVPRSSLPSV